LRELRFYHPNLPNQFDAHTSIDMLDEESHHAIRVLRCKEGQRVTLFDGQGRQASGSIEAMDRRKVRVRIEQVLWDPRDLPGQVTIAVAMPKGDRLHSVLERLVELGVHRFVPLLCDHSVKLPKENAAEKWEKYVIESCKQCERNRLMMIDQPIRFVDWLQQDQTATRLANTTKLKFLAHPKSRVSTHDSRKASLQLDDINLFYSNQENSSLATDTIEANSAVSEVMIAIGPEGGFSDEEVAIAVDGQWNLVSFGERILRVETAVSYAATIAGIIVRRNVRPNRPTAETLEDHLA
jgi:16S rRNA (uracil1498-N3)-methyltransferase